jgi:tRNA(Ile)-lysidine synthase
MLPPPRARNLLRYWIRQAGYRPPSTVKLNEILRQMTESRPDAHPRVEWNGVEVFRRHGRLYLGPV